MYIYIYIYIYIMATASAADPRLKLGLAMLGEPVGFFSFLGFVWGFLPCGFSGCKEAGRVKVRGLQTFGLRSPKPQAPSGKGRKGGEGGGSKGMHWSP